VLSDPTDLRHLVGPGFVLSIDFPASDDEVRRLRADMFATLTTGERLLVASAAKDDFSWELINRVLVTQPPLGSGSGARDTLVLAPALLSENAGLQSAQDHARAAVILARPTVSMLAEVEKVAGVLRQQGFSLLGAVIVSSSRYRWRKYRRFAETFGVSRDPERPWPVIDILEEELARVRRGGSIFRGRN
jgi:hypothetical protein